MTWLRGDELETAFEKALDGPWYDCYQDKCNDQMVNGDSSDAYRIASRSLWHTFRDTLTDNVDSFFWRFP